MGSFFPQLIVVGTEPEAFRTVAARPVSMVWTDTEGHTIGRFGVLGDRCWIEIDRTGVYWFSRAGGVEAWPIPGGELDALEDTYWRSILPHVLHLRGTEALHASAFEAEGQIVGLCGVSGVGKSTLAMAVAELGHSIWADDALALHSSGGRAEALRLPFRLQPPEGSDGALTPLIAAAQSDPLRHAPLGALIVLKRLEESAEITAWFQSARLEPAVAFSELLPHAYWLDTRDAEAQRRFVETYMRIVETTPVYELWFLPEPRRLPELAERVVTVAASQ